VKVLGFRKKRHRNKNNEYKWPLKSANDESKPKSFSPLSRTKSVLFFFVFFRLTQVLVIFLAQYTLRDTANISFVDHFFKLITVSGTNQLYPLKGMTSTSVI